MTKPLAALLAPPTEADVRLALHEFALKARSQFGANLTRLLVFGSRARGEARPDSDVDLAVVFQTLPAESPSVVMELGEMAYEPLVELGVEIEPVPFSEAELLDPSCSQNPNLVRAVLRDGAEDFCAAVLALGQANRDPQ
jgi:predicted nucleotidyltransferase